MTELRIKLPQSLSEDEALLLFAVKLFEIGKVSLGQAAKGVLTSGEIKLKKKEHAIAGLELADLLAYPFKREMIAERRGENLPEDFSSALLDAARPKMHCQISTRRVAGYGKVWLD